MTVWREKNKKTYRYEFYYKGEPHRGTTGQQNEEDARLFEKNLKLQIRREAGGIAPPRVTPTFTQWAAVCKAHQQKQLERPDRFDDQLRAVLRFFGARPTRTPPKPGAPYHGLSLGDPNAEPDWIVRFEDWMEACGLSAHTRNHYRSTVRMMYRIAMLPKYRKVSGVTLNPFVGVPNDRTDKREVTLTVDQIRLLSEHASYHVRLAIAIGVLASKLRLANILALRWTPDGEDPTGGVYLDPELRWITAGRHKGRHKVRRPLVVNVTAQLRRILLDAKQRHPGATHVVTYQGRPVASIRAGVRAALQAAKIKSGLKNGGATFHTLRHSVSTLLAELSEHDQQPPLSEPQRAGLMGWSDPSTAQYYTHLRPVHEQAGQERLSAIVAIDDVVMRPGLKVARVGEKKWDHPTATREMSKELAASK